MSPEDFKRYIHNWQNQIPNSRLHELWSDWRKFVGCYDVPISDEWIGNNNELFVDTFSGTAVYLNTVFSDEDRDEFVARFMLTFPHT